MKVKVIGLIGPADSGKTQTLKMVAQVFNKNRKAFITRNIYKKKKNNKEESKRDNRYTILYTDKRICDCTFGDSLGDIENNVAFFEDNEKFPEEYKTCIAISAMRASFQKVTVTKNHKLEIIGNLTETTQNMIDALEDYAKRKGTRVFWVEKKWANNDDDIVSENEEKCKEIMTLIDKFLEEM